METKNAKIKSTLLGVEDHGILTAFLFVEWESASCRFGGYALDSYDKDSEERIGAAFGAEFIRQVLETVGVDKWESLPGKYVRILSEGWGGGIKSIGHITDNKWFDPEQLAEEMRAKEKSVQ